MAHESKPNLAGLRVLSLESRRAAEMAKLAENAYRDVNIAFANELSLICQRLGLDVWEIRQLANHHPRVDILRPGPGVGGHCIAVDPHYLMAPLRELGRPAKLAEEALRAIANRPRHIAWRAHEVLVELGKRLSDARILLVGVSYKPGVADTRESPAVEILKRLRAEAGLLAGVRLTGTGSLTGRLWDGLGLVAEADGFFELKRSRDRKPSFD